jgi:hypothetical protein
MKGLRFGIGFAIFIIFFALSLLKAFRNGSWVLVVFWLTIGVAFFAADNLRLRGTPRRH